MADANQQDGPAKSHRSGDFNKLKTCAIGALVDHIPQESVLSESVLRTYTEVRMSDGANHLSVFLAPTIDPRSFTVDVEGYGAHGSASQNGYVSSDGKAHTTSPKGVTAGEANAQTEANAIAKGIQTCMDSNKTSVAPKKAGQNFSF